MKLRLVLLMCLALSIGLIRAYDDEYDEVYGAFQIKTVPKGALVTVYDTEQELGKTPTEIFPVVMDEYMTQYNGIPGRVIEIIINKDGYIPLKKEIFVPLNKLTIKEAVRRPTVFTFRMKRTFLSSVVINTFYRPYNYRPRHQQFFYPIGHPYYPNHYPHYNPPYNPPSGGGNHSGGHGYDPGEGSHGGGGSNPPGGGGSHGGGSNPPGGGSQGGGNVNPPGGGSHGGGSVNPPGGNGTFNPYVPSEGNDIGKVKTKPGELQLEPADAGKKADSEEEETPRKKNTRK